MVKKIGIELLPIAWHPNRYWDLVYAREMLEHARREKLWTVALRERKIYKIKMTFQFDDIQHSKQGF